MADQFTFSISNRHTSIDSLATATTTSLTIVSAYWSFDNITTDLYGVYNGQTVNGATYSLASSSYVGYGEALSLTSSSSQAFQVSTPFLNLSYTSFTIEAWIYSTTSYTGDNGVFGQCQCSSCTNQCLYFIIRANRLYIGFTYNDLSGSSTLTISTWYHIAFVYNYQNQQQILYLNGYQDNIKSNAQPYQGTNGTVQIGSTQVFLSTNYFNGYIDNVKVSTRAKSATEILNDASLTAYFSFDLPYPSNDNGPNGLNGTSANTATVTGRVNQALVFTGSSSYFQVYGFYQLFGLYSNKPFSISLWVNPTSTTSCSIIQQSTNQSGGTCLNMIGVWSTANYAGQLTVQGWAWPTIYGPYVTANTWTHISWTYSVTNGYSLYVNGVLFGNTGSSGFSGSGSITWLQIGSGLACSSGSIPNTAYQGAVDELYVHNRELSQTEVTTLANP
ncbi:unnamed protein product [Didymodactylos carnosus]|uniref:LamG-like jellyroll fold domain-containing protein n=1 Tax=Didymodactylos carnosus TaxID=1234261 RepID=A0A814VHZ6_9BILA|nr:unnamed protein product [Didymodactylos carnosus]CAF1249493.1 unnamed protein product [Didymodactylos carnosus]CAF3955342.1 unnamed protein product [Didymodactylos carnosus]CAF4057139.1 unnamed protein product [Didymodactylos carnosus]